MAFPESPQHTCYEAICNRAIQYHADRVRDCFRLADFFDPVIDRLRNYDVLGSILRRWSPVTTSLPTQHQIMVNRSYFRSVLHEIEKGLFGPTAELDSMIDRIGTYRPPVPKKQERRAVLGVCSVSDLASAAPVEQQYQALIILRRALHVACRDIEHELCELQDSGKVLKALLGVQSSGREVVESQLTMLGQDIIDRTCRIAKRLSEISCWRMKMREILNLPADSAVVIPLIRSRS